MRICSMHCFLSDLFSSSVPCGDYVSHVNGIIVHISLTALSDNSEEILAKMC